MALALVLVVSGGLVTSSAVSAAGLPRVVHGKHVMWGDGQGYPSTDQISANNLIYHGGTVQTIPAVYIVYWGPAWQSGFTATHGGITYSSATVQNYVNSFFSSIGGSPWAGVQTQYCQGITAPAFSCTGQTGGAIHYRPDQSIKRHLD